MNCSRRQLVARHNLLNNFRVQARQALWVGPAPHSRFDAVVESLGKGKHSVVRSGSSCLCPVRAGAASLLHPSPGDG